MDPTTENKEISKPKLEGSSLLNPNYVPTFNYVSRLDAKGHVVNIDALQITNLDDIAKEFYSSYLREHGTPFVEMFNNNHYCISYFDQEGKVVVVMTPDAELTQTERDALNDAGVTHLNSIGHVPFGVLSEGLKTYHGSLKSFQSDNFGSFAKSRASRVA